MKKMSLLLLTLFPTLSMATTVNGTEEVSESILEKPTPSLSKKIEDRLYYEEKADENPFSLTTREYSPPK